MVNGRTPTNMLAIAIIPALARTCKHHLLEKRVTGYNAPEPAA
jgi:hypothetical protein